MPKIHVMRTKMIVDVVVDPANIDSVMDAAGVLTSIHAHVTGQKHVTLEITDSRLVRIDAPAPAEATADGSDPRVATDAPPDDLSDMPPNLRRTRKSEPAAAE